ncbi:MAG: FecR domain-containing protein [Mucilaginibacter sp.]|uniref:FecR family protein n=1 Tax=Mucilaginibacter sp. TaxID=1882438 RepID=UPI0032656760
MNQDKLVRLLQEYFDDTISKTDAIELLNYLNASETDNIVDVINEEMLKLQVGPEFRGPRKHDVLQQIKLDPRFANEHPKPHDDLPKVVKLYQNTWLKIAAAVLFVCMGVGLYIINSKNKTGDSNIVQNQVSMPILPGGNKATLTLSNGKVIALDTANDGLIASMGKAKVFKSNKAQLTYAQPTVGVSTNIQNNTPSYNILSTPKGGVFEVILPDGTKVWLNSASSLKFPTEFTGNERRVTLTGEAYFEAAKNKNKPFFVSVNNVEIRVLGTHFNISAYEDDNNITTTLLEGSVQVKKNDRLALIKPGEQAIVNNNADAIKVAPADIEKAMAWKNGYFIFGDEDVKSIMKKISRWYDVEVECRGDFADIRFGGTFYRSKSINELLSYMEEVGNIHFKIIERRVIVMK